MIKKIPKKLRHEWIKHSYGGYYLCHACEAKDRIIPGFVAMSPLKPNPLMDSMVCPRKDRRRGKRDRRKA